jgi:hypothetical protein
MNKAPVFLLMALFGLAAAQQAGNPAGLQSAMLALCNTTKSLLGVSVMVLLILSAFPLLIGAALFIFKKEDKKLKSIGTILLGIGGLCVLLAVIGVITYLLVPAVLNALTSSNASGNVSGDVCNPQFKTYCGQAYCTGVNWDTPPGSNCTCIQY